jgi:hypothetical protein
MSETSILDLTDSDLLSRGIIRLRDVIPTQFWVALLGGFSSLIGIGILLTPHLGWALSWLIVALVLFFSAALVLVTIRVLFLHARSQLEVRILATQLPHQAASLVVSHMSPPGLR